MEDPVSGPLANQNTAGGLSPTAAAAAALLQAAHSPLTASLLKKLWPARPQPKPAALEAALEELERQGAAARLPGKGGKPVWSARPLAAWLDEARGRILEAVRQSKAPLGEKDLRAASGWPKELDPAPLHGLITELEQTGALKRWPGKTRRWWRLSPGEMVPEALLEALDGRAMSRTEWLKAAKARLKGVSAQDLTRAAGELIASGRVFQHTLRIDGKKVEACTRADHRAAFLELYRPIMERLTEEWRRLGIRPADIGRFLDACSAPEAELLLRELRALEQEHRPPNPVAALRARPALQCLLKEEFDRAALVLFRLGRVYMAPHDHPMLLPEAEREQLVADGMGRYYVSITCRA